jgi:hypothetical protein
MSQNAKLIIQGIKRKLGIKSDKKLCLMLGIKQNTLSTWRKRDTLDFNKIISFCEQNNLDLNEVFFQEEVFKEIETESIDEEKVNTTSAHSEPFRQLIAIVKLKKIDLVNTNKEITFFRVHTEGSEKEFFRIVIAQRAQMKKMKVNTEVILILNNKKIYFEKIKAINHEFNRVIFDTSLPQSILDSVFINEIKQVHIHLGYLDEFELNPYKQSQNDKLNQVLLLEKQIERLKKKFE